MCQFKLNIHKHHFPNITKCNLREEEKIGFWAALVGAEGTARRER